MYIKGYVKQVIILGTIIGVGTVGWVAWSFRDTETMPITSTAIPISSPQPTSLPTIIPTPIPTTAPIARALHDVPFTVQAPIANWFDPLYQNACEEASIVMAARWLTEKDLTSDDALKEIRLLANRADALFGSNLDESARDTATLAQDYMPNAKVELVEDVLLQDIVGILNGGNIVLVPLNGKILNNPHYKPPGPLRHMLVIKEYDLETKEFITNDPGTRYGKNYRYAEDVLFSAMHDWDTGDNTPIYPDRKVIIAIGRV